MLIPQSNEGYYREDDVFPSSDEVAGMDEFVDEDVEVGGKIIDLMEVLKRALKKDNNATST